MFAPRTHSRCLINICWVKKERKDGWKEGVGGWPGWAGGQGQACISAWRHTHTHIWTPVRSAQGSKALLHFTPCPPISSSSSTNKAHSRFSNPPEVSFTSLLPTSSKHFERAAFTLCLHMYTSIDFQLDSGPDLPAKVLPTGTSNSIDPNCIDHFPALTHWSPHSPAPSSQILLSTQPLFGCPDRILGIFLYLLRISWLHLLLSLSPGPRLLLMPLLFLNWQVSSPDPCFYSPSTLSTNISNHLWDKVQTC